MRISFLAFTMIVNCYAVAMTNFVMKDLDECSFSLCYENYRTNHFWNKHGERRNAFNHFESHTGLIYSEYGATAEDTIGIQAGFERVTETVNGNANGYTDIELTWKHLFYCKDNHHVAAQIIGVIPTELHFKPALRYGRYGTELALFYYGDFQAFGCMGWYDFKTGYRWYKGFPSDQFRSHIRLGYAFNHWFQILGGVFLECGVFNGTPRMTANILALYPNYRLLKGQIQAAFSPFENTYLSIGYIEYLWGNNNGTSGGCFASAAIGF